MVEWIGVVVGALGYHTWPPMPITFTPQRGAILLCDFGPDPDEPSTYPLRVPPVSKPPEIWKLRRAVVVSAKAANHKHGAGPGVCLVVPFSAKPPQTPEAHDVFFASRSYRSFTKDVWARCAAITHVSHARLDRVIAGQGYRTDFLTQEDMARVEAGMRAALGL